MLFECATAAHSTPTQPLHWKEVSAIMHSREQGIRSCTAKKRQVNTEDLYWLLSLHDSLKI